MSFDVSGGLYRPFWEGSLYMTYILLSLLRFYINCIRGYSSIWLIGARPFLLLRNWTDAFEHFHQPFVMILPLFTFPTVSIFSHDSLFI